MIGGYVPELFWSLVPNEAVNDNLPSKNFESLIKFYLDMKENGIDIPAPTVHFSGWHADPINLSEQVMVGSVGSPKPATGHGHHLVDPTGIRVCSHRE